MQTAQTCCRLVAQATGCAPAEVLPFSTGVIGEPLPVARMDPAIRVACESLRADAWPEAAAAIMTTDTEPKLVSRQLQLGGRQVAITGIAKGAGMIRPDMATMLAFVATDVELRPVAARELLQAAADVSFNRITVDGDTSTNDACALVATGQSAASPIVDAASEAGLAFREALVDVCQTLAKWIVRDGEGASRLVAVEVSDAASEAEAREVAYTVAHSPLVKTAFTAGDPNWGRILAAVGRARVESLDVSGVSIFLDEACVIRKGEPAPEYREEQGARVMGQAEFTVRVSLSRGSAACTVWTCDLSAEYVRINAEYRT
jgi:glutamate N-acetyltransferase/amino-acid N-acetyltransferase